MDWLPFVSVCIAAANIASMFWMLWRARRYLLAEQLLMNIVHQSFTQRHRGTFQAWADAMGDINVDVGLKRRR